MSELENYQAADFAQECGALLSKIPGVFSANVSEDDAYLYTKTALESLEDLKAISTYFDKFEEVAMSVCVETIPFHPGAAKALKEAGLWEDRFTVYGE